MATTKRVYKGKTYVTHLLRRSIRKGTTVTHEALGNLSHLPDHLIEIISVRPANAALDGSGGHGYRA